MGLQLSQKSMDAAVWCAGAGTSHGPVSVCVCLSQVGVLSKRLSETSWFLAWELPSTHFHYTVLKGNSGISKIRVFPCGTLTQTPDLENFASVYRPSKRIIDFWRVILSIIPYCPLTLKDGTDRHQTDALRFPL